MSTAFSLSLSGGMIAGRADSLDLQLLGPSEAWNASQPERNGYRFAMYLPDGAGGAVWVSDEVPESEADHANDGERYFVYCAWPIDDDQERKTFAITSAGTVYAIPAHQLNGQQPAWNAVFGGEGTSWGDQPVWPPHQRRDGGPRPLPKPVEKAETDPAF